MHIGTLEWSNSLEGRGEGQHVASLFDELTITSFIYVHIY